MKRIFFITSIIILFIGCTKTQIKSTLTPHINVNAVDAVSILPDDPTKKRFAECIENELKTFITKLKFVPEEIFRDALFPWFEYHSFPKDIVELSDLMNKELVQERIENLGVRFLIIIHGSTTINKSNKWREVASTGALGYLTSTRRTQIQATVWDLNKKDILGDLSVDSQGEIGLFAIGVPMIPLLAFTESNACREIAIRISECINIDSKINDKSSNR